MAARGAIILLAGVAAISWGVGRASAPEAVPHTRIVKVPIVKTHVETKEVYRPLPKSCTEAIDRLKVVVKYDDDLTANAGEVLDALSDLGRGDAMKDVALVNKATDRIIVAQSALASAANHKTEEEQRLSESISACSKEVNATR